LDPGKKHSFHRISVLAGALKKGFIQLGRSSLPGEQIFSVPFLL
jgi:hypothetical protein